MDPGEVITDFATYQSEFLSEFEYNGVPRIKETEFDDSGSSYDDVEADTELPGSVSADNFKHWVFVQHLFDEDGDGLEAATEYWLAIVENDGEVSVGAYKFSEEEEWSELSEPAWPRVTRPIIV